MDQNTLAAAASVSRGVIIDFEKGNRTPGTNNLAAIQAALEAAGVEFTNGAQPGVKMKLLERGHRVRLRRASERHAATLGVRPGEVATVDEWRVQPGDPPLGRFRLRLSSGAITDWLETSNFERA